MQEEARERKKSERHIRAPQPFQSFLLNRTTTGSGRSFRRRRKRDPSKRELELRALDELSSQKAFQLPTGAATAVEGAAGGGHHIFHRSGNKLIKAYIFVRAQFARQRKK
jgi:hypothetical protein